MISAPGAYFAIASHIVIRSNLLKSICFPSYSITKPPAARSNALPQQLFAEIHHAVDVHVGTIKLEHRELGVVLVRNSFVAKVAVQLVHLFKAADDQSFQIKLGRDAGVERDVERVVMRLERLRRGTGRLWREHRRFDLDIAVVFEKIAQRRDGLRPRLENLARRQAVVLDRETRADQIDVTLTLLDLRVLDPVHFVGHRQHRFGQELKLFDVHRNLAGIRYKKVSFNSNEVAVIYHPPRRPRVLFIRRVLSVVLHQRELPLLRIDLQLRHPIGQVNKIPPRRSGQPARDPNIAEAPSTVH